jgi:two-component system cell cycle sensor histidine kinase PleC
MLSAVLGSSRNTTLLSEYTTRLGDALLRQRLRNAEEAVRIESELANRVKSEFISNMSHELRTPLNTIIGFSRIIAESDKRKLKTDEVANYSQMIQDAANHLLAIINDILDISKLQAGRYTLVAEDVNIEEILSAVLAGHAKLAGDTGVVIQKSIDPNLPLIRGDATKLSQVFGNLINNAIKFTMSGGTVTINASGMSDGTVIATIRDSGVGMTEEELRVAMTPFGQADATRTRWREGAGLGLPIANSLVELHGGRMELRSAKSVGTEVKVLFPSREFVTVVGTTAAMKSRHELV